MIIALIVAGCLIVLMLGLAMRPRRQATVPAPRAPEIRTYWTQAAAGAVAVQPGFSISALLVKGVPPGRRFRNELFLRDGTVRVLDRVAGGDAADTVLRVDLGGPTTDVGGARVTVEGGAVDAIGLECRF